MVLKRYMKKMGIDYGSKKIGVALSDDGGTMAFPHEVVPNNSEFLGYIKNLVEDIGVTEIVIGHSLNNAEVFSANMSDANSRLMDTDYAKEMTEFAKSQIVRQAGMAMLSQANAIPNQVLQLLQ